VPVVVPLLQKEREVRVRLWQVVVDTVKWIGRDVAKSVRDEMTYNP
jgi:hypothetical protein